MAVKAHTPDEAAALLRCKASWLKDQARQRRIPFTFIGGAYRFTDEHLAQILAQFEQQPQPAVVAAPRRKPAKTTAPTGAPQLRARPPQRLRALSGGA